MQGGSLEPKRCAVTRDGARAFVVWAFGVASANAMLGCDTVAMNFGEVTASAVANVYFQQVTPPQATSVKVAAAQTTAAQTTAVQVTAAQTTATHGSFCTVVQTETPNQEFGTVRAHGQAFVTTVGDSLILNITGDDGVEAERRFEQAFFESRQVNTFMVTFANGSKYTYSVWGADACETCPPGAPGGADTCFPVAESPGQFSQTQAPTPAVVE